ncbi:DUF6541 family protein [Psychromicrobium xiongbiense]|uniref:DUF6541 family protein n=1 Tax=Psychromicrobium xiongbiense TaxID=3051184 RepID=UPI003075C7EE
MAPVFAAAILLYFGPGLLIGALAGLRRLNLLALAMPISTTIAASTAVVAPFVRLPYSPAVYLAVSVAVAIVTMLGRLWLLRRVSADTPGASLRSPGYTLAFNSRLPHWEGWRHSWLLAPLGMIIAIATIGYRYLSGIGSPENFSQTFDNIYHLNAVRFIVDHANGSSLTLGNLTDGSKGFYPAAMHDMMALLQMLTGSSVPAAINVGTIVIGAIVWPLSCMFLISRVIGYRPIPLMITGLVAGSFSAFPYLMVAFGILYPNHAAIATLPVSLALLIEFVGVRHAPGSRRLASALALGVVIPGQALTHPSTVAALLAFGFAPVLGMLALQIFPLNGRHRSGRSIALWLILTAGYAGVTLVAWLVLRPGLGAAPWTPFQTTARAIGEIISSAPMGTTIAWVLTPLTLVGLYRVVRNFRTFWWVGLMYGIGGLLYFVVSSVPSGSFRTFLVGIWYNDSFRLAALLPVVTLPLVVLGGEELVKVLRLAILHLSQKAKERKSRWTRPAATVASRSGVAVVCILTAVLASLGSQGGTLAMGQARIANIFKITDQSDLVNSDEYTLIMTKVAQIVPQGDVIVANPLTGGALVYVLADRQPLLPHVFGDRTPKEQLLIDHWDEAAYNTTVCPVVKELRAYWALDFGQHTVIPAEDPFPGLKGVTSTKDGPLNSPGVEVIATVGKARLLKMTACG